jgi:hypothetical protein
MPTVSTYPTLDIPSLDLWDFLFNRNDKSFPDHKGTVSPLVTISLAQADTAIHSHIPRL